MRRITIVVTTLLVILLSAQVALAKGPIVGRGAGISINVPPPSGNPCPSGDATWVKAYEDDNYNGRKWTECSRDQVPNLDSELWDNGDCCVGDSITSFVGHCLDAYHSARWFAFKNYVPPSIQWTYQGQTTAIANVGGTFNDEAMAVILCREETP